MHHNITAIQNCNQEINALQSLIRSKQAQRDALRRSDEHAARYNADIYDTQLRDFNSGNDVVLAETETVDEFEAWFRSI